MIVGCIRGCYMDVFTISGQGYDSNIFVILGDVPTLVDTGTGLNSDMVMQVLERFTQVCLIQQVVLTHEHYDHVGGVEVFKKMCGASMKICAHEKTAEKLDGGESAFAEMLGGHMPRVSVDRVLQDDDTIKVGDSTCQVLETPGHSLGSICLYHEREQVLLSGDTVFAFGDFGRYDLPGGDYRSLLSSIKRLSELSVKRLYPGHGPVIEDDAQQHLEKALYNVAAYR
jgi:hydroxyacylglutathione hydrolase